MSAPEVSGKCPEVFQRHAEAGRMSEAFFPLGSGSVRLIRVPEVIAFDQHTAFVPRMLYARSLAVLWDICKSRLNENVRMSQRK